MVLLTEGLNRFRDLIFDEIDQGQLGTDGTAPSSSDTDLLSADATTKLDLDSKTKSGTAIKFNYVLPSTGGTTTTYKEFELINSTESINFDRIVFTGIDFTSGGGEDLNISKSYFFRSV